MGAQARRVADPVLPAILTAPAHVGHVVIDRATEINAYGGGHVEGPGLARIERVRRVHGPRRSLSLAVAPSHQGCAGARCDQMWRSCGCSWLLIVQLDVLRTHVGVARILKDNPPRDHVSSPRIGQVGVARTQHGVGALLIDGDGRQLLVDGVEAGLRCDILAAHALENAINSQLARLEVTVRCNVIPDLDAPAWRELIEILPQARCALIITPNKLRGGRDRFSAS